MLRCAMTKLAESMASTTQRVSRVEDEVECERARWTEATARLLERIDELERGQRAAIDHLETSIRQAESTHREERRVLEDQLNSLKEEMITRYEESQASTKVAALPREPPNPITIETTKCYQNNDQ